MVTRLTSEEADNQSHNDRGTSPDRAEPEVGDTVQLLNTSPKPLYIIHY